jgi:hypothetical protein
MGSLRLLRPEAHLNAERAVRVFLVDRRAEPTCPAFATVSAPDPPASLDLGGGHGS